MLGPFVRCCHWPWLAYQEGGIVLLRAHCLWHPPKEDALCQCSSNITVAVAGWCVVLITWVCARKIVATWLEGRAITFIVCMAVSYVALASCEVTLRRSHLQMSTHVCSFEGMVTSGYTREAAKAAVCSRHLKKDEALHYPKRTPSNPPHWYAFCHVDVANVGMVRAQNSWFQWVWEGWATLPVFPPGEHWFSRSRRSLLGT